MKEVASWKPSIAKSCCGQTPPVYRVTASRFHSCPVDLYWLFISQHMRAWNTSELLTYKLLLRQEEGGKRPLQTAWWLCPMEDPTSAPILIRRDFFLTKGLPHPLPHPHVTAMPNADSAERRQLTKPTGPDHPGTWDRELQQHAAIFSHSRHRRKQATNTVQSIPEAKPPVEIHGSRPRAGADAKAKAKSSLGLVNRSQR